MSTRARGEHDWPRTTAWRPLRPAVSHPEPSIPPSDSEFCPEQGDEVDGTHPQHSSHTRRVWLAIAVIAAAAIAISSSSSPGRPGPLATGAASAATPRAWFDAYMAAAVDDPAGVCHILFGPELAASYRHSAAGSCESYFADVQDSAVRIEQIVQSGGTAVIELRQARAPRYRWNAVLARHGGGWRAVVLVAGR
jgi:hypothetical protein